jgi:hypothetical protein
VRRRELRESATACEDAFAFLTTEFGYQHPTTTIRDAGFRIDYVGPVLGVRLNWHRGDPFWVHLVRLTDDEFPPRQAIRPQTHLNWIELGPLEDVVGYERKVYTGDFCPLPDATVAQHVAESLKSCGSRLLRGDLRQWDAVERRIKQRFRDDIMQHGNPNLARELGWM